MLHELLLALLGYTGDLIIHNSNSNSNSNSDDRPFKLASDISFIQPSDRYATNLKQYASSFFFPISVTHILIKFCRDLIERIITLGFYYRELDRFATESRNLSWIRSAKNESPLDLSSSKNPASVYRRAIANGVVEILSVYRSAVLHIEQKLLAETVPILATVTQGLNKVLSLSWFFIF